MDYPLVVETDFKALKLKGRGKVRDIYEVAEYLLLVASDRLSAFDVVLPDPIPYKGVVLTSLAAFWFRKLSHLGPQQLVSTSVDEYPAACRPYRDLLRGRSMLVKRSEPLTVECVVRGYLAGSGWKEYKKSRTICGIALPEGLPEAGELPRPIFTPSTKAEIGAHDENISFAQAAALVGTETAAVIQERSIALYTQARDYARERGIIIADTKFEFGRRGDEILLIDEALTPDSSRFWSLADYRTGTSPHSYDKQYVRDYLLSLNWDQRPPAPRLPPEVIANTSARYLEAYRKLTGEDLPR